MKRICLVLAIAFLGVACNERTTRNTDALTIEKNNRVDGIFYKRLGGTIASQPVVLHLHKTDRGYNAVYYYKNVGQWLALSVDSVLADSIYFSEYQHSDNWTASGANNAQWQCYFAQDTLQCFWISPDRKKSFAFTLLENYPEGSLKLSTESYADSVIAFANNKESPMAKTEVTFVTASGNDWLNTNLKKILGFDTTKNFAEGFAANNKKYFEEYKENLPQADDTTIPLAVYDYARLQDVFVRYNENGFAVLEHAYYEFSGGAHGNYFSSFHCFDIGNKKQLALADIVTADSATMQPIVEQYFRKQYRMNASLKQILFEDHLALTNNFYLTDKGIGFLYNPYEVAAYAVGQINVFVPYGELKKYLTPYIRERLEIE
ncbi:MAG TPA: RsiV family protein [Flavipsychrobacter sp.]|nr:RsiV family protein [Flavipsychrobacter sp.]